MQPAVQLLQAGWHDLVGWMLIVGATALAMHTLGLGRTRREAAHILRAYRPADWRQRHEAPGRIRPMTGDQQWQILVAVAEHAFTQAEMAADLHARAAHELEAADDAMTDLLAQYAPASEPSQQPEAARLPAPAPAPLAA